MFRSSVLLATVALVLSAPASANLVADPGFDLGWGGTWWYGYGDDGVEMISWGGNNPEWWGDCATFWADNGGFNSGGIYDWGITGIAGESYDIAVDLRFQDNYDAIVDIGFQYMAADNATVLGEEFLTLLPGDVTPHDPGAVVTDADWETFSYAGSPAPAGTEFVRPWIRYHDVGPTSDNWFFADNVVVTPEPTTLSLLLFGTLAAMCRRR